MVLACKLAKKVNPDDVATMTQIVGEDVISYLSRGVEDKPESDAHLFAHNEHRQLVLVEKVLICGLQEGIEEQEETDAGCYKPPGQEFLMELHGFVEDLCRQPKCERRNIRVSGMPMPYEDSFGDEESNHSVVEGPSSEQGLLELRAACPKEQYSLDGNRSICMRTAKTRRDLHSMIIDELGYHLLVECPPPPLFVLLAGDLPHAEALTWPSLLHSVHLHVLGNVPSTTTYRKLCPAFKMTDAGSWIDSEPDDRITNSIARHLAVPWV